MFVSIKSVTGAIATVHSLTHEKSENSNFLLVKNERMPGGCQIFNVEISDKVLY